MHQNPLQLAHTTCITINVRSAHLSVPTARISSSIRLSRRHACSAAAAQSAGDAHRDPAELSRTLPADAGTATDTYYGRRRKRSTSSQNLWNKTDPSITNEDIESAADAAAEQAAHTAQQLYPHLTLVFSYNSQQLKGTCVGVSSRLWTMTLYMKDSQEDDRRLKRYYGRVTDNFGCLVAAAAADLARTALYGSECLAAAQLPSMFGGTITRVKSRMTLNLPMAVYTQDQIAAWKTFLRLKRPDKMFPAVTTLQAAAGQCSRQQQQQQRRGITKQQHNAERTQRQEPQQQVHAPKQASRRVRTVASAATQRETSAKTQLKAAATAAVSDAVIAVQQYARARPGNVVSSLWAFEDKPDPPRKR